MFKYVIKRLLLMVMVFFIIVSMCFILIKLLLCTNQIRCKVNI